MGLKFGLGGPAFKLLPRNHNAANIFSDVWARLGGHFQTLQIDLNEKMSENEFFLDPRLWVPPLGPFFPPQYFFLHHLVRLLSVYELLRRDVKISIVEYLGEFNVFFPIIAKMVFRS